MENTALIFGSTGAVGKRFVIDVLKTGKYTKVITAGRRLVKLDADIPQDTLVQKVINFENLEAHRTVFKNCLGDIPSDPVFFKTNKEYVLNAARIILEENSQPDSKSSHVHFLFCSSMSTGINSSVAYLRIKAETEAALVEMNFRKLSIFLPGALILVEPRPSWKLTGIMAVVFVKPISFLFNLKMTVSVDVVGIAMHRVAGNDSIKSTDLKKIKQLNDGSSVYYFSNTDILVIDSDKKKI